MKIFFFRSCESEFQYLNNFLNSHNYDFIIDKKYIEKILVKISKNWWANGFNDEALFKITNLIQKRDQNKNYFINFNKWYHGPLGEFQYDCKYRYPIRSLEEFIVCFDKKLSFF